jgi:hypothetical protein
MDTGRLTQGQMIAAGSAVVLLIAMFLPWIGISAPSISLPPGVPQSVIPGGLGGSTSENIWKSSTLDIYLLITALVAIVPAVLALMGGAEEFSFASAATFLLGVVGVILVIAFLTVDFPGHGAERKFGAFIGLVAVAGVAFGGFRAMQDEVAAGY